MNPFQISKEKGEDVHIPKAKSKSRRQIDDDHDIKFDFESDEDGNMSDFTVDHERRGGGRRTFGLEEVAQETQGYRRLRFGRGDGYS